MLPLFIVTRSPVTRQKPCFVNSWDVSWVNSLLYTFLTDWHSDQRWSCVSDPTLPPLSLVGCLFVVTSLFLFSHSGFFFSVFFFVLFFLINNMQVQMVFKANCDVHYFRCCSNLVQRLIFSPALTGKLITLLSFSAVTFTPFSLFLFPSAASCPPWIYSTNNF